MTTRRDQPNSLTDILLGLLLTAAGAVLLFGIYSGILPTIGALGSFVLGAGLLGIIGALVGRTSAGFFSEIVSAALITVLAAVILRYPATPMATLQLIAGTLFLANGIVRLASSTEYPSLRGVFLIAGAASLALGAGVFSGAVPPTKEMLSVLVGIELLVDGVSALVIGRHEHPSRA